VSRERREALWQVLGVPGHGPARQTQQGDRAPAKTKTTGDVGDGERTWASSRNACSANVSMSSARSSCRTARWSLSCATSAHSSRAIGEAAAFSTASAAAAAGGGGLGTARSGQVEVSADSADAAAVVVLECKAPSCECSLRMLSTIPSSSPISLDVREKAAWLACTMSRSSAMTCPLRSCSLDSCVRMPCAASTTAGPTSADAYAE
jgi:hypothetical protein